MESLKQTSNKEAMTDNQLAALEANAEAAHRAEEAERMQMAMKSVDEVAKLRYRTGMTYGIVKRNAK